MVDSCWVILVINNRRTIVHRPFAKVTARINTIKTRRQHEGGRITWRVYIASDLNVQVDAVILSALLPFYLRWRFVCVADRHVAEECKTTINIPNHEHVHHHWPTAACSGKEDRVDMANNGDKTFVITVSLLGRKPTKTMRQTSTLSEINHIIIYQFNQ